MKITVEQVLSWLGRAYHEIYDKDPYSIAPTEAVFRLGTTVINVRQIHRCDMTDDMLTFNCSQTEVKLGWKKYPSVYQDADFTIYNYPDRLVFTCRSLSGNPEPFVMHSYRGFKPGVGYEENTRKDGA
jgi:hypothetical protein